MKQHITKEQLNQLGVDKNNRPVRLKLDKWCMEKDYFTTTGRPFNPLEDPLLSIGQMIEFLDENNNPMVLTRHSQWHGNGWSVRCVSEMPKTLTESALENSIMLKADKELCDTLWEAVKKVLNEE
ncbi:hypothetical protein KAU11_09820 [Candidatus Babeliales bacterium]|nr:hypothetical protein [Candidatus Babeliales bacterium]